MVTTTQRLFIEPLSPNHREAFFGYRSDSETNQYQGWIPTSLEDADAFISKRPLEFNTPESWFQLGLFLKESEQLIGDVGVHFIGDENSQVEIGYTLAKQFHGKGFATEAVQQVIKVLFERYGKHRIVARIDPENTSSIELVQRLEFRQEAHFRKTYLSDGIWRDELVFGLLKSENTK